MCKKIHRGGNAEQYNADKKYIADLREAVTTLEDTNRIARRVFGGAHPTTESIADNLRHARAALRARETPGGASA